MLSLEPRLDFVDSTSLNMIQWEGFLYGISKYPLRKVIHALSGYMLKFLSVIFTDCGIDFEELWVND